MAETCEVCGRPKMPPCPHQGVEAGSMRCLDCGHILRGGEKFFIAEPIPPNACGRDYYRGDKHPMAALACYRLGYERLVREHPSALRAQYVAGLEAALAQVVAAFGASSGIAHDIRELAEQAKGTTP